MADVVRLSIVYDTSQASAGLNRLNGQLASHNGNSKKAANAAVSLAQAFSTGNISAVGLTHSLAGLGGRLGLLGTGLAVAGGLLLAFRNIADKARETSKKLEDQLRTVTRAVDDLLRASPRSPLQTQIENITDAIRELDRTIGVQRMGILERLGIKPTLRRGRDDEISRAILRFFGGGADPRLLEQRGALTGQLQRLTPEAGRQNISDLAAFSQRTAAQFARLTGGSEIGLMSDRLARARKELMDLIEQGLDPMSDQAKQMGASIQQGEAQLRKLTRTAALMRGGLETMADAMESFVTSGTIAFTDFLNNILRLLYRDFTGAGIEGILRGAGRVPGSGTAGSGGIPTSTGNGPAPEGFNPSVQSNVTINVTTVDAQGVATFVRQHGPTIAAEVTRQAGRASSMRRTFRRG
jgi:hypothetical protein